MARNLFIWGYHSDDAIRAIEELVDEEYISISHWFGNHGKFNNSLAKLTHNPENILKERIVDRFPRELDSKIRLYFERFTEGYSRISFYKAQGKHELWHLFYMYADYFHDSLKRGRVEVVLFQNLPHHGVDMVLYAVAKTMGLRTILTMQSLMPNRFWYVEDIDDFGDFEHVPVTNPLRVKIERKFRKELFYMEGFRRKPSCCLCSALNDVRRLMMGRRHKPITPSGIMFKYQECKEYKKGYRATVCDDVSLDEKFVYFPLQLQPELTTSVLGDIHADQLLALEKLSELLPDDWFIYVKENPKQTARQRGRLFYERLLKVGKVKYLSMNYNTYKLIEKSQFVSVVTGTAGWEAISGGKNVLVFGKAWYKTLPRVFCYDPAISLADILDCKVSHENLEEEYSRLMGKTFPGIMDMGYTAAFPEYDSLENVKNIKNFLLKILG